MLKYKDIIDQLSNSDKIHILCDIDSLSDKKYRILNIPGVKTGKTEDYCADELPTPLSLANSWDTELVENVADAIYEKMGEDGINLAVTDGPKVKIDPYRPAFSEDRKLAADMSAGFLRAARERRMNVCLKDFYIRSDERKWLDKEPDERYIYEYLVGPYMDAAKDAGLAAVMTTHEMGGDGYEKANRKLAALVSGKEADGEGVLGENCFAIFREVPAELTVPYLTAGGLCFKGSAVALESALNRYTHLTAAINGGSATREELDEEFRNGRAISPEMLDGAVDRLLDLVNSVKKEYVPVSREAVRELGLEAVKRSSVLLKNSGGLLPLEKSGKKKTEYKLAFAGALGERPLSNGSTLRNELSELFTEKGFEVIGSSRGYEDDGTRNSELINETKKLAEDADAIVIFLGFDKAADARVTAERNVSIPANQQELLHELGKWSLKLVAVVAGECSPDVGLDENCGAIIHAPLFTKYSAKALCQLLSGEASPTGRLANTVYNDSESLYEKHRRFVGADKMKVGVFTGYRHYDRAGIRSGYEFGYGLSYTEFSYSKLVADTNGKVTFSLKNEGERSGTEVVQLYAGINDPSGIRVKKELVAYKAVTLAPGERTTVELTYELPRVYDKTGNRFVTEQGSYTLYVGASVSDIRLTSTIEGGGEKLEPDSEKISEYIETESNIICDDYKLEGKISTMRKSLLNFVLGGAALVLAVLLKLYCVAMALNSFFFDMFEIVLAVVGVILVVFEVVGRNKDAKEDRSRLDKVNDAAFADAETLTVFASEQMFADEFDKVEEEKAATGDDSIEGIEAEYYLYIDKEHTYEIAARDFEAYAAEKGVRFNSDSVKRIFSAMASSRLVAVRDMDDKTFRSFMNILCGYFETPTFIDKINGGYTSPDKLLYKAHDHGDRVKTGVLLAIEAARNTPQNVHFAAIDNVTLSKLSDYFTPFMSYVKNPLGNCQVSVHDDSHAENTYYISGNLWFILNLNNSDKLAGVPESIAELVSVNRFDMSECQPVKPENSVKKFSYYQMKYLVERVLAKSSPEEDNWKKVDKLEETVAHYAKYRIGNKQWLCLEKYLCIYMACGGEEADALDAALSAKLMPSVISALDGKLSNDDRSLVEILDSIFGDDALPLSADIIKNLSTGLA